MRRETRTYIKDERLFNGKHDVPSILFEAIVVDRSNVDQTVIKDGYHRREELYGTN